MIQPESDKNIYGRLFQHHQKPFILCMRTARLPPHFPLYIFDVLHHIIFYLLVIRYMYENHTVLY